MQDEVTVTLELRALIEAIINDYHTTRLDSDYVPHILAKTRTQVAIAKFEQFIRHQAERETLARMEWRPIETAPKDGTRFWGFWPVDDEVGQQQVTYFDQFTLPFPRFCDLADHIDWTQPTAWQPLPPAQEAGQ